MDSTAAAVVGRDADAAYRVSPGGVDSGAGVVAPTAPSPSSSAAQPEPQTGSAPAPAPAGSGAGADACGGDGGHGAAAPHPSTGTGGRGRIRGRGNDQTAAAAAASPAAEAQANAQEGAGGAEKTQQAEPAVLPLAFDSGALPRRVAFETACWSDGITPRGGGDSIPGVNFTKGVRFSPDGTALLVASEDCHLRVFATPAHFGRADCGGEALRLLSDVHEGEAVYDYAWYPRMNASVPGSCCYLTTTRDHPIHLRDGYSGKLRASYLPYNHLDEIAAANCVAFNLTVRRAHSFHRRTFLLCAGTPRLLRRHAAAVRRCLQGTKVFAGFNRMVRVFDTSRPGRQIEDRATCPTRKSRDGQRGILSCIAFNPDYSGCVARAADARSRSPPVAAPNVPPPCRPESTRAGLTPARPAFTTRHRVPRCVSSRARPVASRKSSLRRTGITCLQVSRRKRLLPAVT